jgi:hypothetical protein
VLLDVRLDGQRLHELTVDRQVRRQLLRFLANNTTLIGVSDRRKQMNVFRQLEIEESVDPHDCVAIMSRPLNVLGSLGVSAVVGSQELVVCGEQSVAVHALQWTQMHHIVSHGFVLITKELVTK